MAEIRMTIDEKADPKASIIPPKGVAIVSGGLDSTVLAYYLKGQGYDLHMLSFNYGQRHKKELKFARKTAARLGVKHTIVDLKVISPLLAGSSLTSDDVAVPDGHYAEETMRITVVPNRNAIMLSIAYGAAISAKATIVATAVHAGDHFIYPDCRPPFIEKLNDALAVGNEGFGNVSILSPFVNVSKADIVKIGHDLKVNWLETWSCYKGGAVHCGSCGTCMERREAFELAGVPDPTMYLAKPPVVKPG